MLKSLALSEELLIAMYHLFAGIFVKCKEIEKGDGSSGAASDFSEAKVILRDSPLIDLLWKRVSWRTQTDPLREQEKLGGDPFDHLLYLFGERIGISWSFLLHADRSRTELFEKKVLERLRSKPEEVRAQFHVLQEKRSLSLPLPQAKELNGVLLYAYRDTVTELIRIAGGKRRTDVRRFVLGSIDDCRYLDPEMFLRCDHGYLYDFLGNKLNKYLDAFTEGQIDWIVDFGVTQNSWRWPKQRQCTLDALWKYQEDFGDEFYYSPEDAGLPDEAKPIETLLQLIREKAIELHEIRLNDKEQRVEFRVVMLEQSGTNRAKTPIVTTFEFMGTVSINDSLSSKANPARSLHMKKGKQRYLWQYLRTTYGTDPQSRLAVEKYVSQKLGRGVTITKKDCENLITAISAYGNRPKDDIRSAFVMGETIGLKKID